MNDDSPAHRPEPRLLRRRRRGWHQIGPGQTAPAYRDPFAGLYRAEEFFQLTGVEKRNPLPVGREERSVVSREKGGRRPDYSDKDC